MIVKTYMGVPGEEPVVTVTNVGPGSAETVVLTGGPFAWGKGQHLGAAKTAEAILKDYLQDDYQAARLSRRFMWRIVMAWNMETPWRLTQIEIDKVLQEIAGSDETARAQAAVVDKELPPIASEAGMGVGGKKLSPIEQKE